MKKLEQKLHDLAAEFAHSFAKAAVQALQAASLEDVVALVRSSSYEAVPLRRRKLARVEPKTEPKSVIERVEELLRKHPEGARMDHIQYALDLSVRKLLEPINKALKAGRLRKTGRTRATTYFLNGMSTPTHESASSRSPRRTPLKDGVTTETIQKDIKTIIDEEDSHSPLTDQQIVEILASNGITVLRRTVASHRKTMGIQPHTQRHARGNLIDTKVLA